MFRFSRTNEKVASFFNNNNVKKYAHVILPLVGLVVIIMVFGILTDMSILHLKNIKLILNQAYVLMLASTGVFFVMTIGGLDFSQGSILGMASIVISYLSFYNIILAVAFGILTGAAIGAINGFSNAKLKIPSFIVTICTMFLFRGVCSYLTTSSPVYAIADISKYNTMSLKILLTVIVLLAMFFVFRYTKLGITIKAIGAGETAAWFSGVKVDNTKWLMFVIAGAITGFAAFINVVKVGSVTATGGSQLETQIFISLVLGGLPISGGAKVRFSNIIVGVIMYSILNSGLVMMGLETSMQQLIKGIIFLIFVALTIERESIQVIK
jgi:ribose transport system permease protein